MAKENYRTDYFDAVLSIVNPALVMGLVGSLAIFLLDVSYRGTYEGRLRWTLFFFVFGMVLVSRIALVMGSERGWLYGTLLGGVTYLAAAKFTSGVGWFINVAIIAVIAASAYILTRDTTRIDLEEPNRGLAADLSAAWQLLPPDGPKSKGRKGIWVVYFSLLAIPLFALGQSLIPVADADRRRFAFWLMTVYIGCGLSLILTSALVNLRSYLKSRKLAMPAAMTGAWVASGVLVIAIALVLAAFVPRPHSETPMIRFARTDAAQLPEASKSAPESDDVGKGDGKPGGQNKIDGRDGDSKRGRSDPNAKGKSDRGTEGSKGTKATSKGEGKSVKGADGKDGGGDKSSPQSDSAPAESPPRFDGIFELFGNVAKWLVWIAVALALLFLFLRNLAHISASVRKWLEGLALLFQRTKRSPVGDTAFDGNDDVPNETVPVFAELANPFADGSADQKGDAELVRFTFSALEAWARDYDRGRDTHETALEFAERLPNEVRLTASSVAGLFSLIAYRQTSKLPGSTRDNLRALWDRMTYSDVSMVEGGDSIPTQ